MRRFTDKRPMYKMMSRIVPVKGLITKHFLNFYYMDTLYIHNYKLFIIIKVLVGTYERK